MSPAFSQSRALRDGLTTPILSNAAAAYVAQLARGDVRRAQVVDVRPDGVVASLGLVRGFLSRGHYLNDILHDQALRRGQEIDVIVLHTEKNTGKVALGYYTPSAEYADAWRIFCNRYPPGVVVAAKVKRYVRKGVVFDLPYACEGILCIESTSRRGAPLDILHTHFPRGKIFYLKVYKLCSNRQVVLERSK